jgi:hypothetical protein
MMIDPVYRLDLYGLSSKLSQRQWAHLVQEHFADHPDPVAKAKAALSMRNESLFSAEEVDRIGLFAPVPGVTRASIPLLYGFGR